jgi:hypothetical protein
MLGDRLRESVPAHVRGVADNPRDMCLHGDRGLEELTYPFHDGTCQIDRAQPLSPLDTATPPRDQIGRRSLIAPSNVVDANAEVLRCRNGGRRPVSTVIRAVRRGRVRVPARGQLVAETNHANAAAKAPIVDGGLVHRQMTRSLSVVVSPTTRSRSTSLIRRRPVRVHESTSTRSSVRCTWSRPSTRRNYRPCLTAPLLRVSARQERAHRKPSRRTWHHISRVKHSSVSSRTSVRKRARKIAPARA